MKIKNAKFAQAVRLNNNKIEAFVTDEHNELFYKPEEQILYIHNKNAGTMKLVGITNIIEMTAEAPKGKQAKSE